MISRCCRGHRSKRCDVFANRGRTISVTGKELSIHFFAVTVVAFSEVFGYATIFLH